MILKISARKRKAYLTAFTIAWSYLGLKLLKPFITSKKYEEKLERTHLKNALRLKKSLLALNGLFIKFGQLLSILSNILPEAYAEALESLQDKAPTTTFKKIEKTIEQELGQSYVDIFDHFNPDPIAAASIGQVHEAKLRSGEKVAVKIQHPYIEKLTGLDLQIIENLVKLAGRYFKVNGLDNIYKQVQLMISEELDYLHEANAMLTINANLKDDPNIVIPEVYIDFCSHKILVTSFVQGKKITNVSLYEQDGFSSHNTCENLMAAYCKMLLVDGYYHADPHPGNILVTPSGNIALLDFGAVGILSDITRKEIPKFLQAIVAKDSDRVLASMQKMGFVSKDRDTEKIAQKMIITLNEFINSGINFSDIDLDTINDPMIEKLRKELSFKELTTTFEVPKDWILLQRSIVLLLAIFAKIAPKYQPVDTIKPFIQRMILSKEGFKDLVFDSILSQATTLIGIPRKIDSFLTKANKGELQVEVEGFEKQMDRQGIQKWLFFIGTIGMVGFIMAFISNQFENLKYEAYFTILAGFCSIMFLLILIRFWLKKR